jgi:hypothetical protein
LRSLADRVRQRKERRAEVQAARADAADVAATGPAGQRGGAQPVAVESRRMQRRRRARHTMTLPKTGD